MYTQTLSQQNQMNERKTENMSLMEKSPTIVVPLILRNMVTSVLFFADKSLFNLSERYKLLKLIRYLIITCFVFFLRLLPSSLPSNLLSQQADSYTFKTHKNEICVAGSGVGDSGIARALLQLLCSVNDIPVSSRKYEIVRSLAERLIDENNKEDMEAFRELNRAVLSAAFTRTLCQLEAAMVELGQGRVGPDGAVPGPVQYQLNRVLRVVRTVGDGVWSRVGRGIEDANLSGNSAEKLAAELLWLAQKLAACGFEEEAVERWASASNLAWLSLMAEQRLQGSLVKVSAFLFKQAKNMGLKMVEDTEEGNNKERLRQTKMQMITSWLPLLCRASNGTDVPVLTISERAELEKVLEDAIDMLQHEEQEQVLSLWLHHFTYCPSSDWPNLHGSYARWCNTSRKLFFLHQ